MKLLISAEDATIDMTDLTNNVKLNTAMETVGASLTFDIARNYNDVDFASCENIKICLLYTSDAADDQEVV